MSCGSRYPHGEHIQCEARSHNHVVCTGFDGDQWVHVHWDCPTYVAPPASESKASGHEKALRIAARSQPALTMMSTIRAASRRATEVAGESPTDE